MSGHSKWSTIKHKKAKVDSQRAVVFQKYSRELIVSARLGGPDPAGNFRLRTAIEKAKAAGLPNDNIKRAIEKGAIRGGGVIFTTPPPYRSVLSVSYNVFCNDF